MPAADELFWNIKLAMGAVIVALDLPGIQDRVYGQLVPNEISGYHFASEEVRDVIYPAVVLASDGELDELTEGESEGITGIFPQRCWIVDKTDPGMAAKEKVYLTARKTIMRKFNQQRLDGQSNVYQVIVNPMVIFDPRLPAYQHVVSGMVLRAYWGQDRY